MKTRKKTWQQKMETPAVHAVKKLDKAFADLPEGCTMLIPTPKILAEYIRNIPPGKVVGIKTMRKDLALEFGAEYTCPVTTGIFLRIVSEAGFEAVQEGKPADQVIPFWRAIEPKSKILQKLSFDPAFVLQRQEVEANY